jgi:hypothetical protein
MCTNLSPCSSSLGGLQSWVKAIQSTTQSGRNRIKGSQTHHPALPQGHRDQRLQGQPSRQKSLPFSSCSGDIWAISVSSDCSTRACPHPPLYPGQLAGPRRTGQGLQDLGLSRSERQGPRVSILIANTCSQSAPPRPRCPNWEPKGLGSTG